MTCLNGRCGKPARPYLYALGHRRTALCEACFASLTAMGMAFRPVAVSEEPKPRWLAHLTARDETGRLAA